MGTVKQITKHPPTDEAGVRRFIYHCVNTLELSIGFHPDYRFHTYIAKRSEGEIFSRKECMMLDYMLFECKNVCSGQGLDLMAIWREIYQPEWDRINKAGGWDNTKATILTAGDGLLVSKSPGLISITTTREERKNNLNIPEPRITSDDELMIEVYRITLDKKDNKLTDIPDADRKIARFIDQRYHRNLNQLERALCNDVRLLFPDIWKEIDDKYLQVG